MTNLAANPIAILPTTAGQSTTSTPADIAQQETPADRDNGALKVIAEEENLDCTFSLILLTRETDGELPAQSLSCGCHSPEL